MAEENKTSAFNQAQLQIMRLDENWAKCTKNRENNQIAKYRRNLRTAELELLYDAGKIDRDKKTKFVEKLKKINEDIYEAIEQKKIQEFVKYLEEKELLLREIQEEAGKGSVYKDTFDDDMD